MVPLQSIWSKPDPLPEPSDWETAWDAVVIGAGMAGILTAYYLQEAGLRVLVLEAAEAASGQTGRTTAKITSQHGLKYTQLIRAVGQEKARLYAEANEKAIAQYETLIQKEKIDCQFKRANAYLYSTQQEQVLRREAEDAAQLGIQAFFTGKTELPFAVRGAVCFANQAQFDPVAFLSALTRKLKIWEHTPVLRVHGRRIVTPRGELYARRLIFATHFPMRNIPGFYFLRQHQERSYVLALSGCPRLEGMYLGIDSSGLSFRQAGDYLLLGGGARRTGHMEKSGGYELLRAKARELYPGSREIAHWSAQDCMPHDGAALIGRYSIWTPDWYVATGFQKWGMSTSMVAAQILRDLILGTPNPYEAVFTPQRMRLRAGAAALWADMKESVRGLSGGILHRPRCAHMGCRLQWNPAESCWECPCHGSRFSAEGQLLDNPAKKSLTSAAEDGMMSS